MFRNANLSFEAAPPIKVVFRFFLTAAIFGVIASGTIFFNFKDLSNIYASNTISIVHLLTLGVMSNFIFGALFQMLPVIAGVSIKDSEKVSMYVHYTLLFGTIFLISAFISANSFLYLLATLSLAFAFLYSSYIFTKELKKVKHSNSSRGMFFASISISILFIFALILIFLKNGYSLPFDFLTIKSLHFSFGLFGLFAMLIISVSFQVIEMFYVTPPYPKKYAKYSTIAIFSLLIVSIINPLIHKIALYIIAIILFAHAILTIKLIKNKKRAVSDATIWFWYFAISNLSIFSISLFLNAPITLIATLFSFFLLSVVFAMIFKIVPFLVWFQLNRQGYFDGPMMHEVIHPKVAKRVFYLFIATFTTFLIANIFNPLFYLASLLLGIIFIVLTILIYNAWQKYLFTFKNGTKLDFPLNI